MAMAASLGTAFLKTRPELETPDIQFHLQPFSADKPGEGTHSFSAFTASVLQLRPESTGHLQLTSSSPDEYVAIHPNYLATKTDCDTMVAGVRVARAVCAADPVRSMITEEYAPGPAVDDGDDGRHSRMGAQYGNDDLSPDRHLQDGNGTRWRWLIRGFAFTASKDFALPMPRSCR